jgi:hypothetical protein
MEVKDNGTEVQLREIKFRLHDKNGGLIGYEFHEPNEFGVIQIYHQSLRGDFLDNGKLLVRENYYIPHFAKYLLTNEPNPDRSIASTEPLPPAKEKWKKPDITFTTAKQEELAIGFAEWKDDNWYWENLLECWINTQDARQATTNEELFTLYQQHLKQQ